VAGFLPRFALNDSSSRGTLARMSYRAMLNARYLAPASVCKAIGTNRTGKAIERIYVINLDRHVARWDQMCRELNRLVGNCGSPLTDLTTRFPAVDARHGRPAGPAILRPSYSLPDQLFVEPHPQLDGHIDAESWPVEMTREEIAVALSHVGVWKKLAASDCRYALILEDDVRFKRGFSRMLDQTWSGLMRRRGRDAFDLLYLSYKEARSGARRLPVSDGVFRPLSGLWWLSGYVLSVTGAEKLLDALPIRGPVDLWMNHQFRALNVLATRRSLITQRRDCRSANLYSILPVLSQVGVSTREKRCYPAHGNRGRLFSHSVSVAPA
jgi:GR25 family glycosyltransferase involved in LPS biosynthesis